MSDDFEKTYENFIPEKSKPFLTKIVHEKTVRNLGDIKTVVTRYYLHDGFSEEILKNIFDKIENLSGE